MEWSGVGWQSEEQAGGGAGTGAGDTLVTNAL